MNSKEKCIAEAYKSHGYDWEEIKELVSPDGWGNCRFFYKLALSGKQEDSDCGYYVRPLELQGIENNKGWTKIENESEVPNESGVDFDKQTRFRAGRFTSNGKFCIHLKDTNWFQMDKAYKNNLVTHYQPIEQKPPPFY